ncbi:sialate O-acetylesterase [Echinicola strongylocentroti]|uniref:Sialate O-acetylesterase n=1 Tax=Echinicola strongylocentroti TaxID=1795355 RepID=A0A2Z4IQ63_9BACT|nr:sialate O-acetylesterase [Echinicola strongylocentroti]AWW32686.1 sialate O-acetylesterase [Echinicola strongylocentroti]
MTQKTIILIALFSLSLSQYLFGQELKLGSPFTEHMVLQRGKPINIWGEAKPNEHVSVFLGKVEKSIVADSSGAWKTQLPPQSAGGPFLLQVKTDEESINYEDVMIGEVWICTGQSNMVMGYGGIPEIKELEGAAKNIRTFNVTNTVAFTEQDYLEGEWKLGNPSSAVAFSFAHFLELEAGVPIGIILTAWGSSSIEGWMPRDMEHMLPHFKEIMVQFDGDSSKRERIAKILSSTERSRQEDIFLRTQPNIIYNAMLKPLAPFTIRGMVWYQGEANTKSIEDMLQYGKTLPLWVSRLRAEWEGDPFHFFGVSLPGFVGKKNKDSDLGDFSEEPWTPSWAWMRASQYQAECLDSVQIINTIDLGDLWDIHPKDKLPIGRRLALMAASETLDKDTRAKGPFLKDIEIKGDKLVVQLYEAQGLKTTDGEAPRAFWVADATGEWHRAAATISGETVVLVSDEVKAPKYVRYAFSGKPNVNLVNRAGLPARPFRTDGFLPEPLK